MGHVDARRAFIFLLDVFYILTDFRLLGWRPWRHLTSSTARAGTRPTKEVVDVVVESSNGDIRSAIMALQFACTASKGHPKSSKGTKKGGKSQGVSAAVMLESVTLVIELSIKIDSNDKLRVGLRDTRLTDLVPCKFPFQPFPYNADATGC